MDPELEAARRVGTTLCNKWTLERLIGTGGMAAVYIGAHKIGRREAIKILHTDVARDAELRARFEQERARGQPLQAPGDGRDPRHRRDRGRRAVPGHGAARRAAAQPGGAAARGVAMPDLLRWIDELLDVLAAAHAQGSFTATSSRTTCS